MVVNKIAVWSDHNQDGQIRLLVDAWRRPTMQDLPEYSDNAAAVTGGLLTGDVYRTATGELRIVVD